MYSFEVKRNRKAPKYVKLNILRNGYLVFFDSFNLVPKVKNLVKITFLGHVTIRVRSQGHKIP